MRGSPPSSCCFLMYLGILALTRAIDDPGQGRARRRDHHAGRLRQHPDHQILGRLVEHAAPAGFGVPARRPDHRSQHAVAAAGDGARLHGAFPDAAPDGDAHRDLPAPGHGDAPDRGSARRTAARLSCCVVGIEMPLIRLPAPIGVEPRVSPRPANPREHGEKDEAPTPPTPSPRSSRGEGKGEGFVRAKPNMIPQAGSAWFDRMAPRIAAMSASLAWNADQSSVPAIAAQIASTSSISMVQGFSRAK